MSEAETNPAPAAEAEAKSPATEPESRSKPGGLRKQRVGIVTSTGMDKTIVVEFIARVPHPRFKKIIKRSKKFYAHDENGEAAIGDKVRIEETRPLSKIKRWRLTEVLTHH
ncbi:MAG: 30S ribosomal protein S17 [Akkermansiaceae bacterium]|nr:30S ribosomal protein S17 [Akkermansiaceae bacterium]